MSIEDIVIVYRVFGSDVEESRILDIDRIDELIIRIYIDTSSKTRKYGVTVISVIVRMKHRDVRA